MIMIYIKITDWESINSFLSKQLTILQDQILNLISSDKADPINIINNAATILNIYNNLPEKTIKSSTPLLVHLSLFNCS